MQTNQPINENLEFIKAVIPIFSIIAVVIAAYLNARFTRKQKVIDELFSYKVQAYMKIAEIVYLINTEYFKRFNHIKEENSNYLDTISPPIQADLLKGEKFNSNILFFNNEIQNKIFAFSEEIKNASKAILSLPRSSDKSLFMAENYKMIIICEKLIRELQNEIGLNKIKTK